MTNSTRALRRPPPARPGAAPGRPAEQSEKCTGAGRRGREARAPVARVFAAKTSFSAGLIAAGLALGPAGCGGGVPDTPLSTLAVQPNPGGTVRRVTGDWDDVTASVEYALTIGEAAITRAERPPGDASARFDLLTVDDKTGTLEIRREPGAGAAGANAGRNAGTNPKATSPEVLTITARIGPEGDRLRERRLVEALVYRFEALAGKGSVPVPPPLGWGY